VVDGLLVEHWDVVEDEASQAESKSGSPMLGDRFPVQQTLDGWTHGLVQRARRQGEDPMHDTRAMKYGAKRRNCSAMVLTQAVDPGCTEHGQLRQRCSLFAQPVAEIVQCGLSGRNVLRRYRLGRHADRRSCNLLILLFLLVWLLR
jgi:hypothetical protein